MTNSILSVCKMLLPLKLILWQHPSFTLILISLVMFAFSAILERGGTRRNRATAKAGQIAFTNGSGEVR